MDSTENTRGVCEDGVLYGLQCLRPTYDRPLISESVLHGVQRERKAPHCGGAKRN
jgi:hypothetical protein